MFIELAMDNPTAVFLVHYKKYDSSKDLWSGRDNSATKWATVVPELRKMYTFTDGNFL
jgi:hypothetical protein